MALQPLLEELLGDDPPVAVAAYDGSRVGPPDADTTVVVQRPDALRRIVFAPGELGLARAFAVGDIEVQGSIWDLLELRHRFDTVRFDARQVGRFVRELGLRNLRPLAPPDIEHRPTGWRRHTGRRDVRSVSHHYDVSNDFYRMVLGPTMTYSCAVFESDDQGLDRAQQNKYELICRKLDLSPGDRLLDVGCGWGGMLLHAAERHGVEAVGITLSHEQAELARKRVAEAGLSDRVEVREQDYRDVDDGPYDAISSIGMFEHVGLNRLRTYVTTLHGLLRAPGRLLNHAISRPPGKRPRLARRGFMDRYIFPDGELHEVGSVVTAIQEGGFEVRHVESLREHYARTLRRWVENLEAHWDDAVEEVGVVRARVWRLYLAGCAVMFEDGNTQIHQTLAVKPDGEESGMPLRPSWVGPLAT